MDYSNEIDREIADLSQSDSLKKDMSTIRSQKHCPFENDKTMTVEAFLEFISQYNEFINHEPKPFKKIIDKDMIL